MGARGGGSWPAERCDAEYPARNSHAGVRSRARSSRRTHAWCRRCDGQLPDDLVPGDHRPDQGNPPRGDPSGTAGDPARLHGQRADAQPHLRRTRLARRHRADESGCRGDRRGGRTHLGRGTDLAGDGRRPHVPHQPLPRGLADLPAPREDLARRARHQDAPGRVSKRDRSEGRRVHLPWRRRPGSRRGQPHPAPGRTDRPGRRERSGKTTLSRLLAGLYLPGSGSVAWDGTDLAEADPADVWSKVGLVPQDCTRWPMDLRANIHLGQPRAAEDVPLLQAARAAGADSVFDKAPYGLDTLVASSNWGGTDLSGGQWQRIAVARAFYRNAAMLMLDEPTSAMDRAPSTW
ncbi:ATP-binding cassette domain-containing protein [Streptomyces lydicus]